MLQRWTIGIAGRVDHGKTSLVRALTGIDTDRKPEEKARGLHANISRRAAGMINRVSAEGEIVFIGGVAKNPCMRHLLEAKHGRSVLALTDPQLIGALGAALLAQTIAKRFKKRIKDCLKYDMGCGYRLITLQRGDRVYIPFLGTHDECQRWLESNSRLKTFTAGKGSWFRVSREQRPLADQARAASPYQREDACEASELKVSDEDLRRVFSGLVEAANRRRFRSRDP